MTFGGWRETLSGDRRTCDDFEQRLEDYKRKIQDRGHRPKTQRTQRLPAEIRSFPFS
jgi:hypothetical protein